VPDRPGLVVWHTAFMRRSTSRAGFYPMVTVQRPVLGTVGTMTPANLASDNLVSSPLALELFQARIAANTAATLMKRSMHALTRTQKIDLTDVTDIDVAINKNIIDHLTKAFSHQVLGEELSTDLGDLDAPTWVIDPIDGTFPYTAGLGIATVAISLVIAGTPVLSVVADPWTETLYEATNLSPTLRNGKVVTVTNTTSLRGARVGIAADGLCEPLVSAGARAMWPVAGNRLGASVSDGGLDALCFGPGSPWDIASTALLVERAGGTVLPVLDPEVPVHYAKHVPAMVAAATPELAEELRDFWAKLIS
jgi:fructose-1,6-bisphosphatase/inositol monophosphatase family enzyme